MAAFYYLLNLSEKGKNGTHKLHELGDPAAANRGGGTKGTRWLHDVEVRIKRLEKIRLRSEPVKNSV